LAVESKSDMIIVNVNMVTAKNEPVQGSTPAVILLEGKTKTNIDKTMDAKKLPAGNYIMSVVSEGKTANILFTIKYLLSARNDSLYRHSHTAPHSSCLKRTSTRAISKSGGRLH